MKRSALFGIGMMLMLMLAAGTCSREDGLPDPPLQVLVPCDLAAAAGDPRACPDLVGPRDGGADAAMTTTGDGATDGPPASDGGGGGGGDAAGHGG